jgi:hypothetical protein
MQHDSAAAAVNFVSLLFIAISLDIEIPWRDSVRCSSFWLFGAPKVRRKGRIQRSDTWAGDGCRSVSQSGAKEGQPLTANCRLSKSVSIPISRRLRNGKPEPIL